MTFPSSGSGGGSGAGRKKSFVGGSDMMEQEIHDDEVEEDGEAPLLSAPQL